MHLLVAWRAKFGPEAVFGGGRLSGGRPNISPVSISGRPRNLPGSGYSAAGSREETGVRAPFPRFSCGIHAMAGQDVLGEIDADGDNGHDFPVHKNG